MPLLVVTVMSQLVFSGGMIPVTDRVVLDQLSWITPARWGFAASASTIDLTRLVPPPLLPADSHWKHTPDGVADQHRHPGAALHHLHRIRSLADPPQGRLSPPASRHKTALFRRKRGSFMSARQEKLSAVDVETVRGRVGQRLGDVDLGAAQLRGGPEGGVDAGAAQIGLVELGVLHPRPGQVRLP